MTVTGTIRPVPAVTIGGLAVAAGPNPDGTWPATMVLDGVSAKWGRSKVTDQPRPATATVSLLDPSGTWAASTDLIGQPLTLSWSAASTTRVYFRGRIGAVELSRRKVVDPTGNTIRIARVDLTCTSLLADLGNTSLPPRAAETVAARRTAIAAAAAPVASSVSSATVLDTATVAATTAAAPVLTALEQLYNTTGGDRYTFDPHTQAVSNTPRRTYSAPSALAYLTRNTARVGVFITAPGGWIDGAGVTGLAKVTRALDAKLSRTEVKYKDSTTGADTVLVTPVAGVTETATGVRALSVDTQLVGVTAATTAAAQLATTATEASGWQVDDLTWRISYTGGFETVAQAVLLLSGTETPGVFFLAGSWLPDLGVRPVFGVMGGTITYTGGDWSVTWTPAPIGVTGTPPAAVSFDDLDASLVWSDVDNPNGMHVSVTYDDLAFVTSATIGS